MSEQRMQSLVELFDGLAPGVPDLAVSGVATNSRRVKSGDLFLASQGLTGHGLDYLDEAVAAGAIAVAYEPTEARDVAPPTKIPAFPVADLDKKIGRVADRWFDAPSASLAVTGITGTNGKTTVAWLVAQALQHAGYPSGYSGTLGFGSPPDVVPSRLTTPGCLELHRRLRELVDQGVEHAVIEASSHGLAQRRLDGIRMRVAVFTNLSHDHLDYHGSLENYFLAKAGLFSEFGARQAVINVGNAYGQRLLGRLPAGTEVVTVALMSGETQPVRAKLLGQLTATRREGLGLALQGDFGSASIDSPLWGRFNAENLVLAAGALVSHGLQLKDAAQALGEAIAPPGRMERVAPAAAGPTVLVDFAHTPDALDNALNAVREHCGGRVWCVFGCGGERDADKRPLMGEVAASLADGVVLTDDNPRGESPEAIVANIRSGIPASRDVVVEHDRAAAIALAIDRATPSDAVLIAGKGHEAFQYRAGQRHSFSDRDIAARCLGEAA